MIKRDNRWLAVNHHSEAEPADTMSTLPLVYSCSGCSNVAQLANRIAVLMDREGTAEMSCIAGVGGGVPVLVNRARSGRFILAIDGCALHCTAACLARAGVSPSLHVTLADHGVRKRYHTDVPEAEVERIRTGIVGQLAGALARQPPVSAARRAFPAR